MQAPPSRRSSLPYLLSVFAASFLLALGLARAWPGPGPALTEEQAAAAAKELPAPATTAGDNGRPDLPRREAAPPAVAEPGFEARVDELVRIGQRTAELAQQDDIDAAKATDQEARARFADLMEHFDDAGERALAMLVELPEPASAPASGLATHGRRIVLQLVIQAECERRDQSAEAAKDRARIDAFVRAVLDVMPGTEVTAEVGDATLAHQRFLRAVHEPAVLGLAQLAAEEKFSRPIATRLLLTLWDNLQAFGERSSDELSRLALLLLGTSDASQRTAACRQLLKDKRYRNLILAWLREHDDHAVASEVATLAANELPAAEALALLRELAPALPRATNAYLLLGFRDPDAVADSYRELLASNTLASVRCDLVTGISMANTPLGLDIAQLALDNDPSLDVRVQAVFALTARHDAQLGERSLMRILDDPGVATDPTRLGAMVHALQNLEATGDANAVDRVGQRLRNLPLLADSRQKLDAILQRSLPGGRSAAPGGRR